MPLTLIRYCLLLCMAATVLPWQVHAQKAADNWVFGGVGYNFSSGSPAFIPSTRYLITGSGSVSDQNGNLLFYTDGWRAYDRYHQQLMAADDLSSGDNGPFYLLSQNGLVVPRPEHDSLYYIFSIHTRFAYFKPLKILYAEVNMNRNNGLGEVTAMHIPILDSPCYKITATSHCNRKDIWLIAHKVNSDKYYAFLITKNGISPTPVVSSTGNYINQPSDHVPYGYNSTGYMKMSSNGKMLAAAHRGELEYVELCDFDNQTGVISNARKLTTRPSWSLPPFLGDYGPYGVDFSPNNKYLYVTGVYNGFVPADGAVKTIGCLYQYDASLGTEAAIQGSRTQVDTTHFYPMWAMQQSSNGVIYINNMFGFSTINQPDQPAPLCDFRKYSTAFPTLPGRELPCFPQSYFYKINILNNGNCGSRNVSFRINRTDLVDSVRWEFGEPSSGINNSSTLLSPTHSYAANGMYTVKLIAFKRTTSICEQPTDTVVKNIYVGDIQARLGNDTAVCTGDSLRLTVSVPGGTYTWSNNSHDSAIVVRQAGSYWVRATLNGCTISDTIQVSFSPVPAFSLGSDVAVCRNEAVTIAPNTSFTNATYFWSTGATSSSISTSAAGNYWLQVTNAGGCRYRDSMQVTQKQLQFSLGPDTAICEQQTLLLNAQLPGVSNYAWSTGQSTPAISVSAAGDYWVDVTKDGCTYRDSMRLTTDIAPAPDLGKDTSYCGRISLSYNLTGAGDSYLWSNGSTQPLFSIDKEGRYWVRVRRGACTVTDTIVVQQGFCRGAMPNAFTPGKHINHLFRMRSPESVTNVYFVVYNRWGQKVFETRNAAQGWDGTYNGKGQPSGTYVWTISCVEIASGQQLFYKGTVTLIR